MGEGLRQADLKGSDMIDDDNDRDIGTVMLEGILNSIKESCESTTDLFEAWMGIGDMLGIGFHIPHKRLIIARDEYDNAYIVGLLGCNDEDVLEEMLESGEGFSEEIIVKCVKSLDEIEVH